MDKLGQYRLQIDSIDAAILELLEQRMDIVKKVGEYKAENHDDSCIIRPGREASMIRSIMSLETNVDNIPLAHIWRNIIGASIQLEEKVEIFTLDEKAIYEAKLYFGAFTKATKLDSYADIFDKIKNSKSNIAILKKDDLANYANLIAENENINIFAILPFIKPKPDDVNYYIIGNVQPEETGNDEKIEINGNYLGLYAKAIL